MNLFSDLTKLEKARSGWQAFGFYLAYLCLGLLLAAFAGGVSDFFIKASTFREGFAAGTKFGHFTAVVFCPLVSFLILRAKRNYTFAAIALAIVSGLLALALGMIGGLLPSSVLTCFQAKRAQRADL
jgi:hypothetical protein